MDITLTVQIIKYLVTVLAGVILGNGAVYLFNHMPASWFFDYGEMPPEPDDDAWEGAKGESKPDVFGSPKESIRDPYVQRVRSTPWKYVFSMLYIAVGLYLVRDDWAYALAVLVILWLLTEMSISDIKYRIVPDQLIVLLAVSAIGTIQYHTGWKDMLFGALTGFAVTGFMAVLGKAVYRRESVGGGDIKLFAALGLITGVRGVLTVFMLSALLSGAHLVYLLARGRITKKDTIPMVPYISVACAVYLIFLWQRMDFFISLFL